MIFIGVVLVGILIWNVKRGQYEDMEGDGSRILMDNDEEDDFTRHPDDRKNKPKD
jgi:cbb3-type cytochrome oxidase maturation protein